ncbi:MAG: hypothetical protein P8Z79_16485 [Sedimentisphaerales bacterium]|jgi:hypothetical protein
MSHEMDHHIFEEDEGIVFEGGDGLSMDEAVIIRNALDTTVGIQAENYFISRKLGERNKDWFKEGQVLATGKKGRRFDVITVRTKLNERIEFCFDITDFFGKR